MIKKAIAISIILISAGIGVGIATNSKDIVDLKRRKANIRHQETVNNQRIGLLDIIKKNVTNIETAKNIVNRACKTVDDEVYEMQN